MNTLVRRVSSRRLRSWSTQRLSVAVVRMLVARKETFFATKFIFPQFSNILLRIPNTNVYLCEYFDLYTVAICVFILVGV